MKYCKILQKSIDLHVHVGPEIIPRKFYLPKLLKCEKGKLKGVGVKNHFFATSAMARPDDNISNPFVIDSVTLNNYVGGFNPDIIYSSAQLSRRPIIVWFPTINSKEFLQNNKYEIPIEWIDSNRKIINRKTTGIKKLSILNSAGDIKEDVKKVLVAIKKTDAILATGHISWQESKKLVECAIKKFGIKRIIITHPIYQKINMPIGVQKELSATGAYIEQCYSMYAIDKISIAKIAEQIKAIGAKNCIISSDVGQIFSDNPSIALEKFMKLLEKEGISERELRLMLVNNPNRLIRRN